MASMFCPRCAITQMMNRSTSGQEITGPGGETINLLIQTYYCAICHSFVKSESVHELDNDVVALQAPKGGNQDETRIIHG